MSDMTLTKQEDNTPRAKILPFSDWEPALHIYALLMVIISILISGYNIYFHNQALQIPLVHLLKDPSLYPNDPFAATLPHYASSVWRIVAWCSRAVNFETVLLVFFILERLLLIYAAGSLARALAPKSQLAAVASMAFFAMMPQPILGGGTLSMPYFEQTSLAMAFYMLAIAAFYKNRHAAWALWLGLGFNCNSMYGCYALTYFGAVFLIDSQYRREWRKWFLSLAIFAVLALPAIVMSAGAYSKTGFDNNMWIEAAKARVPHHLFYSTWPLRKFMQFGMVLVMLIFFLLKFRESDNKLIKSGLIWTGVGVGWIFGAVLGEIMGSSSILMLQPARATDFWYAFGVIALIAMCARSAKATSNTRLQLLAALVVLLSFWYPGSHWRSFELAAAGFVMLIWIYLEPRVPRPSSRQAVSAVLLILMITGISLFTSRAIKASAAQRSAIGGIKQAFISRPPRSMESVAKWARLHTPKGSMFLTYPHWAEFRGMARRPAFVTWKDGSAILWDRPYATEWVQRIRALGYEPIGKGPLGDAISTDLKAIYNNFTDKDVSSLAAKYGIRYWIIAADHPSRFRVLYKNHWYKVLEVKS